MGCGGRKGHRSRESVEACPLGYQAAVGSWSGELQVGPVHAFGWSKGSSDPGNTPPSAQAPTHTHPVLLSPHLYPRPLSACAELQIHKHRTERKQEGPCAPPEDQCKVGIPTYHPEVPERNQIVTVRNTTELSKADKISHINCETEVTVLFVLRE